MLMIQNMIENEFDEGIYKILESPVTHEIFITLKFEERNKLFASLAEKVLEYKEDHGEAGENIMNILTQSPYCLGMVLVDKKEHKDYIALARENLQDNEMNYILFHDEVQPFTEKLLAVGDKKLSDTILQYSAFNSVHFTLKIGEAIQSIITQKPEDLDLFKNNPKYAHIGLHQNIKLDETQLPEYLRG